MRLSDLVEIETNNELCVLLKIKEGKQLELLSLGCFSGNEKLIRMTKGSQRTCTIVYKDDSVCSFEWGNRCCTMISDELNNLKFMVLHTLEDDFNIYMGDNKEKIKETLHIKSLEDSKNARLDIKIMYFDSDNNVCVHKNNEYYRHFKTEQDVLEHFEQLGYHYNYISHTRSPQTNCHVIKYTLERGN